MPPRERRVRTGAFVEFQVQDRLWSRSGPVADPPPHSALKYVPPDEFLASWETKQK